MRVKEDLEQKLRSKVKTEFNDFLNYITQKDSKEVINFSYQLVIKELILYMFEDNIETFKTRELKTLLNYDNLLDRFYEDWKIRDGTLEQDLMESLSYSIEELIEASEKKKKVHER